MLIISFPLAGDYLRLYFVPYSLYAQFSWAFAKLFLDYQLSFGWGLSLIIFVHTFVVLVLCSL
jgi:hypothetical protein